MIKSETEHLMDHTEFEAKLAAIGLYSQDFEIISHYLVASKELLIKKIQSKSIYKFKANAKSLDEITEVDEGIVQIKSTITTLNTQIKQIELKIKR